MCIGVRGRLACRTEATKMTSPNSDKSVRDRVWGADYDPRSEYQTDMTIRDLVWNATLELVQERFLFTNKFVRDKANLRKKHSRTVRRTLKTMNELGWVKRPESRSGYYWTAGEKAVEQLGAKTLD